MSAVKDPRILWALGALALVFSAVGSAIAGAIVGIPIALIVAGLGYGQDVTLDILLYSAVLWLPLGFGAGMATAASILRGYFAKDETKGS